MSAAETPGWLSDPWNLGLAIALTGLASWAATGAVLRLLVAWRVYDKPNHRSSHGRARPRGGGLAVVPVALVAWIATTLAGGGADRGFWLIVAGACLLGAISWADDVKPRPASLRFGVQVAAVTLGLWALDPAGLVFQGLLPPAADRLAAALVWLWFINLFNFMDGIDGITAVETVAIGGGLALVAVLQDLAPVAIFQSAALAAVAIGFLYWNWAPSRIFLGDVGSVPLGYLLGWLLVGAAADGFWAVAVILPLYYLADATWTLLRRAGRQEKLWRAHREHFYQRAVQRGFGHGAIALRILLCNAVLVALALAASVGGAPLLPWISLALASLAVAVLLFILARQAPPSTRSESAPPPD
ncbi:MAG: glycosyl transferase [Kiloniellaceae bacterium]|nr:glycosyl transferase [Kiloniellaceae bacterium]